MRIVLIGNIGENVTAVNCCVHRIDSEPVLDEITSWILDEKGLDLSKLDLIIFRTLIGHFHGIRIEFFLQRKKKFSLFPSLMIREIEIFIHPDPLTDKSEKMIIQIIEKF